MRPSLVVAGVLLAYAAMPVSAANKTFNWLRSADFSNLSEPEKAAYVRGAADSLSAIVAAGLGGATRGVDTQSTFAQMMLMTICVSGQPLDQMVKAGSMGATNRGTAYLFGSPLDATIAAEGVLSELEARCKH